MTTIVYADFSCPDCYLAARRCDSLAAAGVPVDVRVVEHRPELPITGRRLSATEQDALTERFHVLHGLLLPDEQLPWAMPPLQPKTEAAVSAFAAVSDTPVAGDVRRLLFELYWLAGADIGNPNVLRTPLTGPVLRSGADADPLRQTGYVVSVDRAPLTTDAYRRSHAWRTEWHEMGRPALPVLLADGAILHGVDALRRLGKEISYAGAEVAPRLNDPRRYPHVVIRPPAPWVSQIGGRWRNVYRPGGVGRAVR